MDNTNLSCGIVNIYSPCNLTEKKEVWRKIEEWISQTDNGFSWCLTGDFNAVRCVNERRGAGIQSSAGEISAFDEFIKDNNLVDLPLTGLVQT